MQMVVNISSTMGTIERNTWGCCAGYRASKIALNSINKTFAVDSGKQGVTFVVIHPGYVQTDMHGGEGNITPDQSAVGLMNVISELDASDNGKFYDWQGNGLPWQVKRSKYRGRSKLILNENRRLAGSWPRSLV